MYGTNWCHTKGDFMRKYWVTLVTGEYGYIWTDTRPQFAEYVTITVETWDGEVYQTRGQVYKVDSSN
ncbi:hypothetical protein [Enterobacteria phage vB_EcoM_IME540]|nr:hypothetical protein [Enterobacteria phage vB_EcoM_IME540]